MKQHILLLLGLACLATASPLQDSDLMKRILNLLETRELEKKALHMFRWIPEDHMLVIQYRECVKGDKSRIPCRNVVKHSLKVFNENNDLVFSTREAYILDGIRRYTLDFIQPGETYRVQACEVTDTDKEIYCNGGTFTGHLKSMTFGGTAKKPINANDINNIA